MKSGYAALIAAKEAQKNRAGNKSGGSQGSGAAFVSELKLDEGETIIGRYIGNFDSDFPKLSGQHYITKLGQKNATQKCATDDFDEVGNPIPVEGHAGCVYCYQKVNGDSSVGGRTNRTVFFGKDLRRQHKLENKVKVVKSNGYTYDTKYPPCSGKGCAFCAQGSKPQAKGWFWHNLAQQFGDVLLSYRSTLRGYCKGCKIVYEEEDGVKSGSIDVTGYMCANCGEDFPGYNPTKHGPLVTCKKCKQKGVPDESYACNNPECTNPLRCDMEDFLFEIKKTGSQKSTSFSFNPQFPPRPMSDEERAAAYAAMPKWDELFKPDSAARQALLLGVPNPFKEGDNEGAEEYDPAPEGGEVIETSGEEVGPTDEDFDSYAEAMTPKVFAPPPRALPPSNPNRPGPMTSPRPPPVKPAAIKAAPPSPPKPLVLKPAAPPSPKPSAPVAASPKLVVKPGARLVLPRPAPPPDDEDPYSLDNMNIQRGFSGLAWGDLFAFQEITWPKTLSMTKKTLRKPRQFLHPSR